MHFHHILVIRDKSFINSYSIICVFALLLNKASPQAENVAVGVTGGSVVLPCATSDIEHKLSDINVFWRHNDKLPVCAIIEGKFSLQAQDFNYTNRVETFPTEYEKGNLSLKLNNLTHTDRGNYQCFIIHSSEEVITQLIIKESTVHTGKQPTEENGKQWIILTVFFVLILCLVLCISSLFIWKKRSVVSSPKGSLPIEDGLNDDSERHANGNIELHSLNPPSEQETETMQ